jgi:hypothetical protein
MPKNPKYLYKIYIEKFDRLLVIDVQADSFDEAICAFQPGQNSRVINVMRFYLPEVF